MKPFYVVLLMGAAALGGGLVVRYSDHPTEITLARPVPPAVLAPPIPPTARVGPSNSVPVRSAPHEAPAPADPRPVAKGPVAQERSEKPSALSEAVHLGKADRSPSAPQYIGRVRIPPEPPAIIPLERSIVTPPAPAVVASAPEPARPPSTPAPQQSPPEPNRATLKSGMLITVRINQALSSNLNSQGDVFSGTLERPLIADGFVIAERGAQVRGEVVDSKSAGGASELSIRLREILSSDGQRVHLVSDPWRKLGSSGGDARSNSVYDVALTRGGAAVIRPATSVTFRLDQPVELTEKR